MVALSVIGCTPSYDTRLNDRSTRYLGRDGSIVVKQPASYNEVQSYWDGDGVPGAPAIVINLHEQKALFYKGGKLVGVSPVSSGREGFDTPSGNFKVVQKDKDHASNLFGDYVDASGKVIVANVDVKKDPKPPGTVFRGAPMPFFLRIHGGVGMHAGFLPGVPDSHGCIRMPIKMAEIYFINAEKNTPVQVITN